LGLVKHVVPQALILGTLFFIHYINYLSMTINRKSKLILF